MDERHAQRLSGALRDIANAIERQNDWLEQIRTELTRIRLQQAAAVNQYIEGENR